MHNTQEVETEKRSHPASLIVCHECDLLQAVPQVEHHGSLLCWRCRALLTRNVPDSIERTIALSIAGIILFAVANLLPFLSFGIGPQVTQTNLVTGVQALSLQGEWLLAGLVFFTAILAPAIQLGLMLYIFVPLSLGRPAAGTRVAFRLLQHLRDWNMIEVFMIGILVALVKLAQMATIVPGVAMWSFMLLIFIITAATASVDGRIIWQHLENRHENA